MDLHPRRNSQCGWIGLGDCQSVFATTRYCKDTPPGFRAARRYLRTAQRGNRHDERRADQHKATILCGDELCAEKSRLVNTNTRVGPLAWILVIYVGLIGICHAADVVVTASGS